MCTHRDEVGRRWIMFSYASGGKTCWMKNMWERERTGDISSRHKWVMTVSLSHQETIRVPVGSKFYIIRDLQWPRSPWCHECQINISDGHGFIAKREHALTREIIKVMLRGPFSLLRRKLMSPFQRELYGCCGKASCVWPTRSTTLTAPWTKLNSQLYLTSRRRCWQLQKLSPAK